MINQELLFVTVEQEAVRVPRLPRSLPVVAEWQPALLDQRPLPERYQPLSSNHFSSFFPFLLPLFGFIHPLLPPFALFIRFSLSWPPRFAAAWVSRGRVGGWAGDRSAISGALRSPVPGSGKGRGGGGGGVWVGGARWGLLLDRVVQLKPGVLSPEAGADSQK